MILHLRHKEALMNNFIFHKFLYQCYLVAMAEVGYQNLLRGRIREAQRYYKTATKLDESSIQALSGIIR